MGVVLVLSAGLFQCSCLLLTFSRLSRTPDESKPGANNGPAKYGEIRQGTLCLDTLGGGNGARVGLFQCHSSGGNQVRTCACTCVSCVRTVVVKKRLCSVSFILKYYSIYVKA